mmetsp:Transcript_12079/g.20974  ORF Transcript_12079/g.20974 Transcript_12079/m.20974 type:complete len:231 (-) Transcript_12079:78-770(-)
MLDLTKVALVPGPSTLTPCVKFSILQPLTSASAPPPNSSAVPGSYGATFEFRVGVWTKLQEVRTTRASGPFTATAAKRGTESDGCGPRTSRTPSRQRLASWAASSVRRVVEGCSISVKFLRVTSADGPQQILPWTMTVEGLPMPMSSTRRPVKLSSPGWYMPGRRRIAASEHSAEERRSGFAVMVARNILSIAARHLRQTQNGDQRSVRGINAKIAITMSSGKSLSTKCR